ncbi:hypothetical protein BT69DRAFT_1348893 [Atractiella rhizophila]|nr:hypothetical protein BT69DRAFT_1348893 [Atractiella rhizophila]
MAYSSPMMPGHFPSSSSSQANLSSLSHPNSSLAGSTEAETEAVPIAPPVLIPLSKYSHVLPRLLLTPPYAEPPPSVQELKKERLVEVEHELVGWLFDERWSDLLGLERKEGEEWSEWEEIEDGVLFFKPLLKRLQEEAWKKKGEEWKAQRSESGCGHVFRRGEPVYRCRTCSLDPTCVLCSACFRASDHIKLKHEISFAVHRGDGGSSCCDCGDEEAWVNVRGSMSCRIHNRPGRRGKGKRPGEEVLEEEDDEEGDAEMGGVEGTTDKEVEQLRDEIVERVKAMIDWVLEIVEGSRQVFEPPKSLQDLASWEASHTFPHNYLGPGASENEEMKKILKAAAGEQVDLDAADFRQHIDLPSIDLPSSGEGNDDNPLDYNTLLHALAPDATDEEREVLQFLGNEEGEDVLSNLFPARGSLLANTTNVLGRYKNWSVSLWNDDRHSFQQVIDMIKRNLNRADGADVAQRIHNYGKEVVFTTEDPRRALEVALGFWAQTLGTTVRPSRVAFHEDLCGVIIAYLSELAELKVRGQPDSFFRDVITSVLLERTSAGCYNKLPNDWINMAEEESTTMFLREPELIFTEDGSERRFRFSTRLERLFLLDLRFWKKAKLDLRELYVKILLSGKEKKIEIGRQFSRVFARSVASYVWVDKDHSLTILEFAVQLLTSPSVADDLAWQKLPDTDNFLTHILDILYAYCTGQTHGEGVSKRLALPPTINSRLTVDPEHRNFRTKLPEALFSHFLHLLQSEGVKASLREYPPSLEALLAFFQIFMGMDGFKRAVGEHVLFDSDKWTTAFHLTISLGKIARAAGEAFRRAPTTILLPYLHKVMSRIVRQKSKTQGHNVEFDLSFHHPLHLLLSEMLKNVEALDPAEIRYAAKNHSPGSVNNFREFVDVAVSPAAFMLILEGPLRVCAVLAQGRANLWVRNGDNFRTQAQHYRRYSLKENTFDQDIYLLQVSMVMLNPAHMLVTMMDRFNVIGWLGGKIPKRSSALSYEPSQILLLVEEFLVTLSLILNDPIHIEAWDRQRMIRDEIVTILAVDGPCAYSSIVRSLSDRFVEDSEFDRILQDVSEFRKPISAADSGTYTLKEECYSEVNPANSCYSRNNRVDVEQKLVARLEKITGQKDHVVVPRKLQIPEKGLFSTFTDVFKTSVLACLLFHSIYLGRPSPGYGDRRHADSETLVDESLRLVMMALVNEPVDFAEVAVKHRCRISEEKTLAELLCSMEFDTRMKYVLPKVRWCLDRLTETQSEIMASIRRVPKEKTLPEQQKSKAEDAKAAAERRRAAIMQQFADAQKNFLSGSAAAFLDEDDEDEEDENVVQEKKELGNCIHCHEKLGGKGMPFGCLAYIQRSRLIRTTPDDDEDFVAEIMESPSSLDRDASDIRPFGVAGKTSVEGGDEGSLEEMIGKGFSAERNTVEGLHTTSCGHLMHVRCYEVSRSIAIQRQARDPTHMRSRPEDPERGEIVCPLCKHLCNVFLPVAHESNPHPLLQNSDVFDHRPFHEWLRNPINDTIWNIKTWEEAAPKVLQMVLDDGSGRLRAWCSNFGYPRLRPSVDPSLLPPAQKQIADQLLRTSQHLTAEVEGDQSFWYLPQDLLTYTLSSIEIALRGQEGPLKDGVTERQEAFFTSLLAGMADLAAWGGNSEHWRDLAGWAVAQRLISNTPSNNVPQYRIGILQRDPLSLLIETAIVGRPFFRHMTVLMYYCHVVRLSLALANIFKERPGFLQAVNKGWRGKGKGAENENDVAGGLANVVQEDAYPAPAQTEIRRREEEMAEPGSASSGGEEDGRSS